MKNIIFVIFFSLLCLSPAAGKADSLFSYPADTITIQIGKSKKIVIWVDNKEDLAGLQVYDINKMIRDLNKSIDSLENPNQVLIITDENGEQYKIEVDIESAEEEEISETWYKHEADTSREQEKPGHPLNGLHFNKGDKSASYHFGTKHSFEFDLGMNNYLNGSGEFPGSQNEQYTVRPWGSWYVGINSQLRTHIAGPLALQWGGGISWYNFKFQDDRTRIEKTEESLLFYREGNSEISAIKSKLTATYLNLNLVPMLDFRYKTKRVTEADGSSHKVREYRKKAFRIGLGPYAGYRINSYTKHKFERNDNTRKEKDRDNFYLNNWRYGLRLQVGFRGVDLFANYDLNNLFSTQKAPELHGISFGITL